MQTMTYNPPTAQVTQQKDVTYGNVQPNTKAKKGKKMEPSGKKTEVIINPSKSDIQEIKSFADYILSERGDYWHPDPEQDRKLGGPGANQRAREDRASTKEDPKKLKPGESYMDYAKRHGYKSPPKKEGLRDKLKRKLGLKNSFEPEGNDIQEVAPPGAKYERMVKHIKKNYPKDKEGIAYATAWKQKNKDQQESAVPGKPAERLGAVTAIPQSERDAAKARLLAKTAAKRKEREMTKEEFEIEEGMTMKDFKANRKKNERRAASADAEKRGHVGKEWHNTGNKYTPDQAKSRRANMSDYERQKRYQTSEDPDSDNAEHYPASKTKNPKKLRKQKAMGEAMSFSDFMEARRMDKEGVDRGDSRRAERAEKAKASLAAKQKRQSVLDKHEKKTGTKLDISRSKEGKDHARNFPGSRQEPKERGKKETPSETQNRRINASNARKIKHGFTSKEKREAEGMAKHTSRFD